MQTAKVQLPPKLIPCFQAKARYRGAYGGRGSGKTYSFAKMSAVIGYWLGKAGVRGVILCAREHLNSLAESSMEEVKEAIRSEEWLEDYYDIGETYIRSKDKRISYIFTGLRHNLDGVKSKARILIAWIDEAENVSEVAWRKLIPTVRAEDQSGEGWWESEIWITWNPESEHSATNQRFRVNPPDDAYIVELNWRDNPWFTSVLEKERQEDYRKRPDTYNHVWEGDYLILSDAQIFAGKYEVQEFEIDPDWSGPYHGLDFGFANDPTAATCSYIEELDSKRKILYIPYDFSQPKLELDDTAFALTKEIPRIGMHVIRADNARPESISYLRRHGLPGCVACKKGKGSVEDGIEYLKNFEKIIIHPRCVATLREMQLYSYKVDKLSGDVLPIIIDAYNHCIDSLRYAHEPMIRSKAGPKVRVL